MTAPNAPLLELRDVRRTFRIGPNDQEVLAGAELSLARGESLAVVGPSGCGKSTLLNLMAALDRPSAGKVLFDGKDLADMSDGELASLRQSSIGLVFQLHHLLGQCTALENVLVPTIGLGDDGAPDRARGLLAHVGLADRMNQRPATLSGGERQRVAVARALINRPSLLLADEPTGSLDEHSAASLANLLAQIAADEAMAMVVVTHSRSLAGRMSRVLALHEGRLVDEAAK